MGKHLIEFTYRDIELHMFRTFSGINQGTLYATREKMGNEKREKVNAWKKKAWLDFCKEVILADNRFSLMPYADYYNCPGEAKDGGVFGTMCLVRTGTLCDIYILPPEPNLGFKLEGGSKYTHVSFNGYPSKAMVYPLTKMSDEVERQFIREVSIEATKHGMKLGASKGGKGNGKPINSPTGDDDDNQLSTSS